MQLVTNKLDSLELDNFIQAFEAARGRGDQADLAAFLPGRDHPLYQAVLRELVCIDLEYGWERGQPRRLEDYQPAFPELFHDKESLQQIAFEEYRLRRQAGQDATPVDYERRFGVDTAAWPAFVADVACAAAAPTREQSSTDIEDVGLQAGLLAEAALAYQESCQRFAASGSALSDAPTRELLGTGFEGSAEHAQVFAELHGSDPAAAERLAQAVVAMPRAGMVFAGFCLLAELGRGAFGRVYQARQGELANRLVVLKVMPSLQPEAARLAQLQHTHIVPIYSVHQMGAFQAVCMPYFGATTLADVLKDLRRRQELPVSGKYLLEQIEARRAACHRAGVIVAVPAARPHTALDSLTYVEAILSLAVHLADGLAHAHERGIVHRDLKPANVLLTDDAQPMLLDFNLSEDTKLRTSLSAARIGGTLLYMAPEQLDAFDRRARRVEARSDLYAFGLILYELLSGRRAFTVPQGPKETVLAGLRADRLQPPPELRRWNHAVSPAVESIVRHCLEPEFERRYQSARELREDLQRQLAHRPLKYARDPSLWERVYKWTRRHPRLTSSTGVGVFASLLFLVLLSLFLMRLSHLAQLKADQDTQRIHLEAAASLHQLDEELKTVEVLLGSNIPDVEPEQLEDGTALARKILDRYGVLEIPSWQGTALVSSLSSEQRQWLLEDMGEILMLLAKAKARHAQLAEARRLNELAEECYPANAAPQALWRQRSELARLAGRTEESQQLFGRAEAMPLATARDRYLLLLTDLRDEGIHPEVLAVLRNTSRLEKDNFSVWLILGNCYARLGKSVEAVACYDLASALWPNAHWPYLYRGLVHFSQKNYRQACADFNEVIHLRPDMQQAYYNRALAKYHVGDLAAARADVTHLLEDPEAPLRAYFLRARIRAGEGDKEGARQDREEGLRREPRDERDWTARGLARLPRDPQGALADFDKALERNPRYHVAMQNKASVLSEDLGRIDEAIPVLDKVIALEPSYVPARAGRGVLLARLGRRDAAHADAREALQRDTQPFTIYQVAGIYALTSRGHTDDRREALRLLASALRQGFGLELLDGDHDLDPIRDLPEFRRIVEAARALRAGGPSKKDPS
jgi:serine/threonine protein kinase/lipoprotein NlpI